MKKSIVPWLMIATIIGCNTNPKKTKMEKFDLVEFNTNKNTVGNKEKYQFTESDSLVILTEEPDFYLKEKKAIDDSLVVNRKAYNKESLNLEWSGKMIYNAAGPIMIGISKNYDSEGNLIKEFDHDKSLTYPVTGIIEKVKTHYNMEIDPNEKTYSISRNYEDKLYYVNFKKTNEYGRYKPYRLVFDGITGEFIKEEVTPLKY